jgi:multisubunit Na+/H+ antiporter MnhG subunit
MKKIFDDTSVIILSVIIGIYYIVLGAILVTMEVSNSVEIVSLVVPALITGSLTTLLVQKLIRSAKEKKSAENAEKTEQNDEK